MNKRNVKLMHDAGVQIGFGSDSGVGLRIPGPAEHRELVLLVEAGLTPMQAISIATSQSAKALNLVDRGTVAAGKLADFVVLNSDPSVDITNMTRIHAVWHRGKRVGGPIEAYKPSRSSNSNENPSTAPATPQAQRRVRVRRRA